MAEKNTFTAREIAVALNNTTMMAKAPPGGPIPDKRLAKLSEYATLLLQPISTDIEEGYLRQEEAVFICLAGALLFQCRLMGTDKLPAVTVSKKLLRKEK